MNKLTKRQNEVLELIQDFIHTTGFPPTRADIAQHFGFHSLNAAEEHLRTLERKEYIKILPGTSRGIRIIRGNRIPIIGKVAAGSPVLSENHIQGKANIDPKLFKPSADYLLKVDGNSMRNIGIIDGDLLAVHRTKIARSGQIIVARVNNEVTVKRFRRHGNRVQLIPENSEFNLIEIDPQREQFDVEGLAVGLIRNDKIS